MRDLNSVSPLRILEKSVNKRLDPGKLGVVISRAGVGKTTCLVHIGLVKALQGEKLVHVTLEEGPDKVTAYYNVMLNELINALKITDESIHREVIERNRMILAYLNRSFETDRLKTSLENLRDSLQFKPTTVIVDGVAFEDKDQSFFQELNDVAQAFECEVWLSARSHRHITQVNERGIPYPCDQIDDLFSIIMLLKSEEEGVFLKIAKDNDFTISAEASLRLDPHTFLVME
jgi:hypothetical protein